MHCFLVQKTEQAEIVSRMVDLEIAKIPSTGDVLIEVAYSALNYKDALAAQAHAGVALKLPLVPGIDAVGKVVESSSAEIHVGRRVMVAHGAFGTSHWGGWSQYVRVPADWCIPLADSLSDMEAITLGTAGFTAAQSADRILAHGIGPADGPAVVSGATGGVGVFAVRLLSQLGFEVIAVTGKTDRRQWLIDLGASDVMGRDDLDDHSNKPLLKARWAAAVDTVGGHMLATILKSACPGACITACGLVGGVDLNTTVYPFILRGVALQGIDTAGVQQDYRKQIWNRLAHEWKIRDIEKLATIIPLADIQASIDDILQGQVAGRIVVQP